MDEVVLTMKKLFQFLSQKGYKTDNYWLILASPRSREHKVKPAMQHNEIILIINQIERKEAPGKRDFAILSLAVTTGLRAGDIPGSRPSLYEGAARGDPPHESPPSADGSRKK